MNISISAGHSKSGIGSGSVGLINESTENRRLKDEIIRILKINGHTVNDCTIDTFTDNNKGVRDIVTKHNNTVRDIDVQIHFNCGANDQSGNGKSTGSEVLVYSPTTTANKQAELVCDNLQALGFVNRGVKVRDDLWFIRKTDKPAILIETCFVDDADDVLLYKKSLTDVALAIAKGIVNDSLTLVNERDTSVDISFTKVLVKYGSKNESVTTLQRVLNTLNYKIDVDGIFGNETKSAVMKFQKDCEIDVDGIVGKDTWTKLFTKL